MHKKFSSKTKPHNQKHTKIGVNMKKFIAVFISMMISFSFAQTFENSGVQKETDDFTGATTCSQTIVGQLDGQEIGISFSTSNPGATVMAIGFYTDDPVYNLFTILPEETIMFRFYGEINEVFTYALDASDTQTEYTGWYQFALTEMSMEEIEILNYYEERIRIRLNGSNQNMDFDFPIDWRIAFANEFLRECIPDTGWQGT